MELTIAPEQSIKEIQDDFQKRFSHLKIEFFEPGKPASPETLIDAATIIGSRSNKPMKVEVNGLDKVRDLEKKLNEVFGLNTQVFRKSGEVWLQTTVTDQWTLAEHNQLAREKDKEIKPSQEHTDYHEQE